VYQSIDIVGSGATKREALRDASALFNQQFKHEGDVKIVSASPPDYTFYIGDKSKDRPHAWIASFLVIYEEPGL
jgi:hypothetical protein